MIIQYYSEENAVLELGGFKPNTCPIVFINEMTRTLQAGEVAELDLQPGDAKRYLIDVMLSRGAIVLIYSERPTLVPLELADPADFDDQNPHTAKLLAEIVCQISENLDTEIVEYQPYHYDLRSAGR